MIRKAKQLTGEAVAKPFTLLDTETKAVVLERLTEMMRITIKTPVGAILFYAPTPLLVSRAQRTLTKEADTIRWIDSFPDDCVFWDIGANIGVYSLYAGAKRGVRVLSFEPLAANFHVLSRNIQINGLDNRLTAYCVALAGSTKLGVLNMASSAMGSALSQFGELGEMSPFCTAGIDGCAHGTVGFTVDDFVRQFRPPFPNYVKLDVDGLEWVILQGAKNTLKDSRLRSVMVELSLSDKEEHDLAVALLENSGFRFVSRGELQETDAGKAANHLFERSFNAIRRSPN